jgi:hypothetical protein
MPKKTRRQRNGAEEKIIPAAPTTQTFGALKLKPAQYLSLSKPSIYRLVTRGLLHPNRATRHLLFSIEELNRFLRDGMSK